MRTFCTLLLLCSGLVRSAPARAAEAEPSAVDHAISYAPDRLELRLAAPAAAAARLARPMALRVERRERLGIAAVDRVAADLGGAWFEPEFRGESPPPPGSDETDFTAFYIVHLEGGAEVRAAAARFGALLEVERAESIAVLPVSVVPNDSMWNREYWHYQPSRQDLHSTEAWDVTTGDTSIVVAVLDSGVLPYHPDLGGSTRGSSGQIWTNWAERGGIAGVDDDGNGFVDDVAGWDFVALSSGVGVTTYEDWRDQDNDPNDYAGHGTAVAGLVGAIANNSIGIAGTVWKTRIMPLRMAWSAQCCPLGLVDMSFAAQAIRYATRMGASVINCSFSSINQAGLDAAVNAAVRAGIVVVSAAGNQGQSHYLGDREDGISVAATNASDVVPSFSNTGPFVDLAAPGTSMFSTFITRLATTDSVGRRQPDYTIPATLLNGTSFSSPLVAGAAALVHARRAELGLRRLQPMGMLLRLRETTDDIAAQNPSLVGLYGTGRLNLYRAVAEPAAATSSAWWAGARTVGPTVAFSLGDGTRLAWLTNNQKLLVVGAAGDTLTLASLPVQVTGTMAGADLGLGRGLGLFAATLTGKVLGFDALGSPLPGWPVTGPGGLVAITSGPALGDLDGDGTPEIAAADDNGEVWAWSANGTLLAGFPVSTSAAGIGAALALSDLDGAAGVEIIAATRDGFVHALRSDGSEAAGWPFSFGATPVAPVVTRWGAPVVLMAGGGQMTVLNANGTIRFGRSLDGLAAQDPALGDFDGDGSDEVVIATTSLNHLQVIDSTGSDLAGLNWSAPLPGVPQSAPVLGHLRGHAAPDVLVMLASGLVAFHDSAGVIAGFPKPGGAGLSPTLLELDGDGRTEVAAGSGADSSLYVYDAGPGSWNAAPQPWPTARGNFARTGSRNYAPALDATAPGTIGDLTAVAVAPDSIVLQWTAPGDDGALGRASAYEVRASTLRPAGAPPSGGSAIQTAPLPATSGASQTMGVGQLSPNTSYSFWIAARDEAGNQAPASNVATALTALGPPTLVSDLAVAGSSDTSITLRWTVPAGSLRPSRYEVRGAPGVLDEPGFASAPLQRHVAATAKAGQVEQLTVNGLMRRTRYAFALRVLDAEGRASAISNITAAETRSFARLAGRPGPAILARRQPATRPVEFVWQGEGTVGQRITVFDLSGRRVRSIRLGLERDGATQWDGRDDGGQLVPAGLYFARLISGSIHVQTRVVLLP